MSDNVMQKRTHTLWMSIKGFQLHYLKIIKEF